MGIKQEDIPKLFQQFEQIEKGCDRITGGTGLGLAISKEIILSHKGKIWAESPPAGPRLRREASEAGEFGKGTTFHFILPIKERRI